MEPEYHYFMLDYVVRNAQEAIRRNSEHQEARELERATYTRKSDRIAHIDSNLDTDDMQFLHDCGIEWTH